MLILPVFQGPVFGPGVKDVGLEKAYRDAKLTGKKGESLLVTRRDGDRFAADAVLLYGVGPKDRFDLAAMRKALGRAGQSIGRFGRVATTFPQAVDGDGAEAVQAAAEGLALGAYRFDRFKSENDHKPLTKVTVLGAKKADEKAGREAARRAGVVAEAVAWARDLVNTPAGALPPAELAREAQRMAKAEGLACKVWTEAELKKRGFGGILGVGQGSVNPPRLIELTYDGGGSGKPIALTGKGVAFDSGGLSIKDAKGMETMKIDMGGAASILATMQAIARLKPKIKVIAAIPSAENMPSGSAQKPGDVITHYGGTTSEVLNTDAEGPSILADALAFLAEKDPVLHHRHRHADRGVHDRAGHRHLGRDGQRRGARRRDRRRRSPDRRLDLAVAPPPGVPAADRLEHRGHQEHRRPLGRRDHGGVVPRGVRRRRPVGAPRHRRPGVLREGHDLGPKGATGVPVRALVRFVLDRAA